MPTKSPGERWRYIAFRIESEQRFSRNEFLHALITVSRQRPLGDAFRITVFERDMGILKVPHTLKEEAIGALRAVESIEGTASKVVPLKTSGTIKTLKMKYFPEQARGARRMR